MLKNLQNKLLLATLNSGKIVELRQLLSDLKGVQLLTLADVGHDFEVDETGQTYAENAALKARAYAQASGLITLADDSGLEVDALGGAPGIRSKRYSPQPGATDSDRRRFLVQNLAPHPAPWTARFRAVMAISIPGQETRFAEGLCEGVIITEDRGTNGFGYDPIFYIPSLERTMAELTDEEKNDYSHRGNAVRAAIPILQEVLGL